MDRPQPPSPATDSFCRKSTVLLLPALLLLAVSATLRLPLLGAKPFWIAEIQEFAYAWRDDAVSFLPFAAGDILGFAYQKCCALLGLPQSPFIVRGLSALTGCLLPPALFLVLARRRLRFEGAILALLAAVSLPLVEASQEARYYVGLAAFLGLGLVVDLFPERVGAEPSGPAGPRPTNPTNSGASTSWVRSGCFSAGPEPTPPAPGRGGPRSRQLRHLGLLDGLALLCHPYALFWIALRWCARRPSLAALRRRRAQRACGETTWDPSGNNPIGCDFTARTPLCIRSWLGYAIPVVLAASIQAVQIGAAYGRFRTLHDWFLLEAYPPGFQLLPELLALLAGGTGWPVLLLALLAGTGVFLLSAERPGTALRLLLLGTAGPLLVTLAIWLARARFSFTHMLPAAVPIYLAAAIGIAGLARLAARRVNALGPAAKQVAAFVRRCRPFAGVRGKATFTLPAAALAALLAFQPLVASLRFLHRPTRLELGADIRSACEFLGRTVKPGDLVITRYDKYFTAFAYYCGATLPPGTVVAAPEVPDDPFFLAFNHLFPEGPLDAPGPVPVDSPDGSLNGSPLPLPARATDVAVPLNTALSAADPGARVFVLVPYFEDIEGEFNEAHGWLDLRSEYGSAVGPGFTAIAPFHVRAFRLLNVLLIPAGRHDRRPVLRADIQTVFDEERPLR